MNFNLDLYDKTEAKEIRDFETLELGGHELVIKDVREHTNEQNGNVSLKVSVDIGGKDKQAGFFQKQYDSNTNKDKKWNNGACKYLSLKDENIAYLKGFITACEKSNPSFTFNKKGTWEQFKNLKIAGQFGLEEYTKQDGTIGTVTKLINFRSLDKLSEIKIPKVKKLNGEMVEYKDYQTNTSVQSVSSDEIIVSDEDLPF